MMVTMKPNHSFHSKGLHGNDVTSILMQCSRDEVTGSMSFGFVAGHFHESNLFSQAWVIFDGANEEWNDSETMIMREKIS